MKEHLVEIADQFHALAATLAALKEAHANDPETLASLDLAQARALRGASLALAALKGASG